MMFDTRQLNSERSLMPCSSHGRGLLPSLEDLTYLLHAAPAPRLARTYIKRKSATVENKQERRTQFRQQEGKEGGSEGRKEGRMAEKQRPSSKMLRAPSNLHIYFRSALSPMQFTSAGFKIRRKSSSLLHSFQPQHPANNMQLYAIYVHCAGHTFNMLQIPFHLQL